MEEEKPSFRYIKFFDDVRSNDVGIVGGKNASLGELLSFGIPVPLGFAVTADAYDYILETNYFRIKDEEITLKDYIKRDIDRIAEELKKEDIKTLSGYKNIFTYEDHLVNSGLGAIVGNLIALSGISVNFHSFGITGFAPSGSTGQLYKVMNLDPNTVSNSIKELIQ